MSGHSGDDDRPMFVPPEGHVRQDGTPPRPPAASYPQGAGDGWKSRQVTVESTRKPRGPSQAAAPPTGPPAWDGPPPYSPIVVRPSPLERLKALRDRMSIRVRLTLTYGALFFAAGSFLLLVMYVFARTALNDGFRGVLTVPDDVPPDVLQYWRAQIYVQRHTAVDAVLNNLLWKSLLALLGVGIIALILGYFVADRALRPVQKMTAIARKLSETSLAHERIDLQGPDDELKELADTFDAMLTRLNRAFDAQRRFVDNASHELRTPLAINRTVLEVALGDPGASPDLKVLGRTLLGTNARNEHLIEGLLLLARSERELSVRKPVDVREVAKTVVEQLTPFAQEGGVLLHSDLYTATTTGDPVLLERCVANLVENGIKYNVAESGQLWVRTGILDGGSVVQVANTGPHVPAYEVDDLFEPFRRLTADRVDSARGAGLGLSIVRAVVRAHGGSVKAVPRDGGGLVVTVRLPSA